MADEINYVSPAVARRERRRSWSRLIGWGGLIVACVVVGCLGLAVTLSHVDRPPTSVPVNIVVVNHTAGPITAASLVDAAYTPGATVALVAPGGSASAAVVYPKNDYFREITYSQGGQLWGVELSPDFYDYGGTYTITISPGSATTTWQVGGARTIKFTVRK